MTLRPTLVVLAVLITITVIVNACTAPRAPAEPSPEPTTTSAVPAPAQATRPTCDLPPVVAPTAPAEIPRYVELDPVTNLHMTGAPPKEPIDLATYRLKITGKVDNPVELTYDEVRCLPKVQASPLLVCPGFFEDQATWGGTPIKGVLALAGIQEGATSVTFMAASDKYRVTLSMEQALQEQNLIAYEWEGQPLPRYHGFPFRLVLPDMEGNQWVKWITEIVVE
jgi:DMSO/TMAO reductase YedYZ molybdopterin-dependent catalytic subunit